MRLYSRPVALPPAISPTISAPPFVPHRVQAASLESFILMAHAAARKIVAPFFILIRPKAESSVGARGLMQLMPDTAEWVAGKLKIRDYAFDRMWDPESNIRFGCWYLNYLSNLFRGDLVCVACATAGILSSTTGEDWISNNLVLAPT